MISPRLPRRVKMASKKTGSKAKGIFFLVLRILAYLLAILGSLLTVTLRWLNDTLGSVSFSTALFQLKTPMVGVDNNIVDMYVKVIGMPAVIKTLIAIIALCALTYAMKVTGYSLKLGINKLGSINITYRPVLIAGTLGLLAVCWMKIPALANKVGFPEYVDSIVNRSTIYEDYYVVPSDDLLTFPEQKRNLVVIYVESLESSFASVEQGGGMADGMIPNLYALAQENTSFSDTDTFGGCTQTNGVGWTVAALLASSSGVTYNVPVEGNDMQEYSIFLPGLRTLGDILLDNGYDNYFACGSESFFGGRMAYYNTHGSYKIEDYLYAGNEGYIPEGYHNGVWGMEDYRLFDMAKIELTNIAQSGNPFNYMLLTADNHFPDGYICDYCEKVGEESSLQTAIRCTDRQVASFVEWIQEQDWYENTTVIIIGDHLIMSDEFFGNTPAGYERRVYNCFINLPDGLTAGNTHNRSFSTTDYFPTILAAMGVQIEGDRLGLGTNLFSDQPTLLEQMGLEEYNTEVLRYSEYYIDNFV